MLKVARRRIAPACSLGIELWLLPLVAVLLAYMAWGQQTDFKKPPKTRRDNVREVLHGIELVDPYRWLEDQNSPETRAWIAAQNEYSRPTLRSLPGRQQRMQRLTELLKIDVFRTPRERNGRYFFSKRLTDQELFVIYMRKGLKGEDQVLIDPHPMSPDRTTSVNLQAVSRDGTLLAYGVRQGGEDEIAIKLLDVETRKRLTGPAAEGTLFRHCTEARQQRLLLHALRRRGSAGLLPRNGERSGRRPGNFRQGVRAGEDQFRHSLRRWAPPAHSRGARLLSAADRNLLSGLGARLGPTGQDLVQRGQDTAQQGQDTAQQGQDTAQQGSIVPVVPVVNDIEAKFWGEVGGKQLFLHTNWKAPKGRILAVELENPGAGEMARDHPGK